MKTILKRFGQVGALSALLYSVKDVSSTMSQNNLDLHAAISSGDKQRVQRLIEHGADVNAVRWRKTPFENALDAGHPKIAKLILENENFNPGVKNQMDRTSLFYAAKDGEADMVQRLLDMGCEVDFPDVRGVTPLGATAWYDKHNSTEILLQNGANLNTADVQGVTPLYRACSSVSTNVVDKLLESGCDVNAATNERHSSPLTTPVMAAIPSKYEMEVHKRKMSEMIGIVKSLLAKGCDLNMSDKRGRTALHHAVDSNEYHSACLFMEHGCDLNKRDQKGLSPLHIALQPDCPRYELALCLLQYGCDANQKLMDPNTGLDILPITLVLKSVATDPQKEEDRQRVLDALIMATDFSNSDLSDLRGENSAQTENDMPLNQTWPFSFQHQCRLSIRKSLATNMLPKIDSLPVGWCLKKYLALNYDYRRFHPLTIAELHTCVMDNDAQGLDALVRSKTVDVNAPLYHQTPLARAAQRGHLESTSWLLRHGANLSDKSSNGQSAMHVAASNGRVEILEHFICENGNVNDKNDSNNTPLLEAAINGQFNAAILLCLNGGDASSVGNIGIPAIHYAAGSGHVVATETFAKHQADMNALDGSGNTALHIAASKGFLYLRNNIRLPALYTDKALEMMDAVKMMLCDQDPKYVKQEAVDHVTVVKRLLESGCDPRIRNQESKNALDISRECGFHEVNRILQNWITANSE